MMNRWAILALVFTAWLTVGCTGNKGADRGGLMLVVAEDGTTGIDMLRIAVSANGAVIKDQPYRVPQEAPLPTTLGIVSNGDPALLVSITVIGLSGNVPIDRRDIMVTGVPVDRVGTLRVVLSARCKGKVLSGPNGQVASACLPGTTCDPVSETCVDANVMGSVLPTFNGDLDATAPSVDTIGASGDEVPGEGGEIAYLDAGKKGDASSAGDGSVSDVPCTANFKKCGGQCVGFDDPAYGCGPTACTPLDCPAVPDGGTLVCQGTACVSGTCAPGTKKCGAICAALDDPKFGCAGAACDSSGCPDAGGGTLVCKAGACTIGACAAGLKDCGGQCVPISDPAFGCGKTTCDNSTCPAAGTATLACGPNGCVIGTCGPGMKKCGAKCVAIADPTYGCGAATCDATPCPPPGAGTLSCQSGACVVGACTGGTKKCGSACVTPDANNGCGDPAVCTACAASESCVGSPVSKCACVPDNVTACTNKNCGPVTNNCGAVVSCGACASPETCGGAAAPNKCGCTGTNPCTGGKCGKLDDGCGNLITCGCAGTDTCGGGGTSGVCGCTPVDPCTGGKCGTFSDGCGKSVVCGCSGPCDILGAAGSPCVAAHSTVRALYGSYTGPLYQVCKGSYIGGPNSCTSGMTKDIGLVPGGYADGASQDTFCNGGTCTISIIYDQSPNHNDLRPAPAGGAKPSPDDPANATDLPIKISGHSVYGILIKPLPAIGSGTGYRKLVAQGVATGDQPETEYMVTGQKNLIDGCCFDYGNAETTARDDGSGSTEAVYFGGGVVWGTGFPGGRIGPWVMADLENGLYAGWEKDSTGAYTDQSISTNMPLKFDYVTAVLVGDTSSQNGGMGRFALYGADATSGALKTEYDGIRPTKVGYNPKRLEGSIVLGISGDNSDSGGGEWFEGVMTSGAATLATCNAVQANIVAAGYGH